MVLIIIIALPALFASNSALTLRTCTYVYARSFALSCIDFAASLRTYTHVSVAS